MKIIFLTIGMICFSFAAVYAATQISIGISTTEQTRLGGGAPIVQGNLLLVAGGNITLVGGGNLQCVGSC